MEKRWTLKQQGNAENVNKLAEDLGVSRILSNLLVQRNITTYEEAFHFFRPSLDDLHDPFLMLNMDKAVERIGQAIDNNEGILVYGDYDVDGTTSVALVFAFFKDLHSNIDFYIPDRYSEGYGISYNGIDYAYKKNISLIIALDCGIKAVDKVKYAKEKGIDFIICDHHLPGETLPDAVAILDPKQSKCNYPYKELSGCGIGYKLAQAYTEFNDLDAEFLHQYLDLVAVSIAADIVELKGENRVLAHFGLKKINENPRPGLEAILNLTNIDRYYDPEKKRHVFAKEITISDIVFTIGPRINASGRIGDGKDSVELLKCNNRERAKDIATGVNANNDERRNLDALATQEAHEMIKNSQRLKDSKTTVVYSENWHKGVVGIVSSRLIESFYRPTIVMSLENDMLTGSARSVKGFDVYSAIEQCSDLLENFGGHKYAAGLSIKRKNIDEFIERFEKIVAENINEDMLIPEIVVDDIIDLKHITRKFHNVLKQFAPFGPGNMTPVFLTKDVLDSGNARIVGKHHLKMQVVDSETLRYFFDSIAFNMATKISIINSQKPFSICYTIDENTWNARTSLQLVVKDLKYE